MSSVSMSDRAAPMPRVVLLTSLGVFVLALTFYLITVRPNIGPSLDSAELHLAVVTNGIVHPPGSPQYVWLARLASIALPGPDASYRVNLFSALCMAAAIALLHAATYRITRHNAISVLAALILAVSPRMWYLGSVAELYALNSLYIAALLLLLITWHQTRRPALYWAAMVVYAFSFGNHTSMLMLLPMVLYVVLITDPGMMFRPRNLIVTALIVLIAAAQYLWIPYRMAQHPQYCNFCTEMQAPIDFVDYVTGGIFKGAFFGVAKRDMIARFSESMQQFSIQFMPWGLITGAVGIWEMIRREWKLAVMLLLGLFFEWLFIMGYNIPDWHDFMSPSYVLFTPFAGYGMWRIWQEIRMRLASMSAPRDEGPVSIARGIAGPALAGITVLMLVVLSYAVYPNVNANTDTEWDVMSRSLLTAEGGSDQMYLIMPRTFSAAYYYSYAIPYYAIVDGIEGFAAVPPYDLAGLPLGFPPLYQPWKEHKQDLYADDLITAAEAGTLPTYLIVDPSEPRFEHLGLLPTCVPGSEEDVIAGYHVVATRRSGRTVPLVAEDRWVEIEPWVVFPGDEAVCPD